MMIVFHDTSSIFQIVLLILSQFTVITLLGSCILLFKHKCSQSKLISVGVMLLFNVVLYVLMQLDSRITGIDHNEGLYVPSVVLLIVIVLSLLFGVKLLLDETLHRKTINHRSIKESFDNLPTGVCFFNQAGFPILCNSSMHRFLFAVCHKSVQFIADLEECLADHFIPMEGVVKDDHIFILSDGTAWKLEKRIFEHESGDIYTQYIAADVTDLQRNREELMLENDQLRKVQTQLKKLSANIVKITREEEILNTKMRVHDEMGKCLMAAQRYLKENMDDIDLENVINSWSRAVSMLKYNNDTPDEDMMSQIRKTCQTLNLSFIQNGNLPIEENVAYILICAVRECVTNAVRYAGANKLYADFYETETDAVVVLSNSGKPPEKEIIEGGGLSTLRQRVERAGGTMTIRSLPVFELTVRVPKRKAGVL